MHNGPLSVLEITLRVWFLPDCSGPKNGYGKKEIWVISEELLLISRAAFTTECRPCFR